MAIDKVAEIFGIPDLRPALADYIYRVTHGEDPSRLPLGGRRTARANCPLPFDSILVWDKMRIQLKTYHRPNEVAEPRTLMVSPPSKDWPTGQYDNVLISNDPDQHWPKSGIDGEHLRYLVYNLFIIFHL